MSSVGYVFGVLRSGVDADRLYVDHDLSELQASAAGQIELLDPAPAASPVAGALVSAGR